MTVKLSFYMKLSYFVYILKYMLKVDPSALALTKSFMKASHYDLLTY